MRVFVTGASGWIGSAVVPELIGAGHQVLGLARSDASAAALTAAGAEVQRGTLDRRAVETFGEALVGYNRPFVIASGTLGLAPGRVATEQDGHGPNPAVAARGGGPQTRLATAELALSLASRSVRSSVVRLPPTNHGHGFIAALVAIARDKGVSRRAAAGMGIEVAGASLTGLAQCQPGRLEDPRGRPGCRPRATPAQTRSASSCSPAGPRGRRTR